MRCGDRDFFAHEQRTCAGSHLVENMMQVSLGRLENRATVYTPMNTVDTVKFGACSLKQLFQLIGSPLVTKCRHFLGEVFKVYTQVSTETRIL